VPHKIKPHLRRPKPKLFRHGECSRAILGMLRTAAEPMTVRQIADRLVDDYHLDLGQPGDMTTIRTAIARALARTLIRCPCCQRTQHIRQFMTQ
jgi:hypothetical protein